MSCERSSLSCSPSSSSFTCSAITGSTTRARRVASGLTYCASCCRRPRSPTCLDLPRKERFSRSEADRAPKVPVLRYSWFLASPKIVEFALEHLSNLVLGGRRLRVPDHEEHEVIE